MPHPLSPHLPPPLPPRPSQLRTETSPSRIESNTVRPQKANRYKNHNTTTTALIIPASFSTATLFPLAAMRVNLEAEPLRDEEKEENVSVCGGGARQQYVLISRGMR